MTSVPTRAWYCPEHQLALPLNTYQSSTDNFGGPTHTCNQRQLVDRADVLAVVDEEIANYQELGIPQPSLTRLRERLSE